MDLEELRKRSASRRAERESKPEWRCQYCNHEFAYEKTFMNHRCKQMDRALFLKTVDGAAAYSFYSDWLRMSGRSVPSVDTFAESKFFEAFKRFAEAVKTGAIKHPKPFMQFAKEAHNISPTLWCNDRVMADYLRYRERTISPAVQYMQSLDFAKKLCLDYGFKPSELFKSIDTEVLILAIKRDNLDGWFLWSSPTFREFKKSLRLAEDPRFVRLDVVMNGKVWNDRLIVAMRDPAMKAEYEMMVKLTAEEGF